jgi:hypothetical protein
MSGNLHLKILLACAMQCWLPAAPADEPVRVSVLSILASEKHTTIERKVEGIAREVRRVDPKLTGFKLVKMTCKSLPVGGTESFELADRQSAVITVERGADQDNRVQLRIAPPRLGEITYVSTCGKFLPILTRYRTADNELLILAVRVQPCTGDGESP